MANAKRALLLEPAVRLIEAGVPVFVAKPVPTGYDRRSEFFLPKGWQRTEPDVNILEAWRPGWAVCAVTGIKFDVLDVDPRNGGDDSLTILKLVGAMPPFSGEVSTPSGGSHFYTPRSHLRKSTNVWDGIDIQAGDDFEYGRGFVYIPPTIRRSKVTGQALSYRWVEEPSVDTIGELEGTPEYLNFKEVFKRFYREPLAGIPQYEPLGREMSLGDPWAYRVMERFQKITDNLRMFPRNVERTREKSEWVMLNKQSVAAGGLVAGSGLAEQTARWGLLEAVKEWESWGWEDSELEYFIDRGIKYGKTIPIRMFDSQELDEWGEPEGASGYDG
mgnify:CR=1 FL=1